MDSIPPPPFKSNYPRAPNLNPLSPYPRRGPGVYWDTLGLSIRMIGSNFLLYSVSSLLVLFLLAVLSIFGRITLILAPPIQIISAAFSVVCLACFGVKRIRGQSPALDDAFQPFRNFSPTFAIALLIFLAQLPALGGLILAFEADGEQQFMLRLSGVAIAAIGEIAWVVICPTMLLAAIHSAMTGTNALKSLRLAFSRLGFQMVHFSVLCVLSYCISWLGCIAFCFGAIFTYPIAPNVLALHYTYYFPVEPVAD